MAAFRLRTTGMLACVAMLMVSACGSNQTPQETVANTPGPRGQYDPNADSVFGDGGFTLNRALDGSLGQDEQASGDSLPVNKFLWQASLDTLSFLPLASTDPFTGVIATDWGTSPAQQGERFKVTAYMVRPSLSASSLKVAVYRELRNEEGVWVPAPVDPETARKLEDAILVRARQIRIAELEGTNAS